jgi:hypothetical protein
MFDTVTDADDTQISPWVIIDGKTAGNIHTYPCGTGSENATDTFRFYKLKGFRDVLLNLGPFEIQ